MAQKSKNNRSTDFSNTQEIDLPSNTSRVATPNASIPPPKTKPSKPSKSKKRPKGNPVGRFCKRLLTIIVAIFVLYSALMLYFISKVDKVDYERTSNSGDMLSSITIKNVLLIGTDSRSESDNGRSDSMVLLSIDGVNRKVTMSSFMRDMYVTIPNYGEGKLNSAYAYGGASLLMDTIEDNFNITVDDCILIDFQSFMAIVDSVGGVDVTVSDSEVTEINNVLRSEGNKIAGDDKDDGLLTSSGEQRLNGKQALTYSRIRYVGNADFERTQRQRYMINAILDRLKTPNLFRVFNFANTTASELTTSMDTLELYSLSIQAPFMLGYDITQQRIPADDTWYYDTIDGQSVIIVDKDANYRYLLETIYQHE